MAYNPVNPHGQATMANSAPVVIASNQTSLPIAGAVTTNAPSYVSGAANALSITTVGALRVDGSAVVQPARAATALPSAASDGTNVSPMADKYGRTVVLPNAPRDIVGRQTTTITTNGESTIISAGGANVFNHPKAIRRNTLL